MPVTISGRVVTATANGSVTGQNLKKVYLQPSRTDFEFLSGGIWQPWEADPNLGATYPGAIAATTNTSGDWSLSVPYTDTEIQFSLNSPEPPLVWSIADPNPATGPIVYFGKTPSAIMAMAKTTKQLIALAAPDTWNIGSAAYVLYPDGDRRYGTVAFTVSTTAALVFPTVGTTTWRFIHGVESDEDAPAQQYTFRVDRTSKSDIGATCYLSDIPPPGKTVYVHVEVIP